ncbi:EAL domain-containing protein [Spirochaeta africana]|uniref:EAL domain-containing protein n=1 Tax=Spirochaeta africana (strain ATCC 700263 / DSM 8902 / Z-7692) TaxID=889378 RepID=H9UM12_SPIAZ|nr:EAL domain-containing protein [Spirochaeta africana]AFG38555.1 EAL domain-containing protein [Spirochaeta africana DSM 8902]
MSLCTSCEQLPEQLPGVGVLYAVPPMNNSVERMAGCLQRLDPALARPYPGILRAEAALADIADLFTRSDCSFSMQELRDTKAMFLPPGIEPQIRQLAHMEPLSRLLAQYDSRWLRDLLQQQRITTAFQPIVQAHDPSQVYAYECLTRGYDQQQELVPPGRMFAAARAAGILFYLDREARLTSIRNFAGQGLAGKVFVNFNPTAVYRPEHCLITTMDAIAAAGLRPQDVVFEVVESDSIEDVDHLLRILEYYRVQGFGVALDDLGAGYSSLTMLGKLKPDYVKLDLELIRDVDSDPYKERIAANLFELAARLEITTIAEGVETAAECSWLQENGADLLQGYYFARPSLNPLAG